MGRWRDIKQGKIKKEDKKAKETIPYAPIPTKIFAFIIDMFLIMMPIAYTVTYLIMGDKESMQNSLIARSSLGIMFGVVLIVFWVTKGQSPGYKAYNLYLVDAKTLKKPSLLKAVLRYILFLISSTVIIGEIIAFFRKDSKTMHDLLSGTFVIKK
ncbi:MAG: RDD family protein [Epsilonproteobacteria bacterium]|nr:RDD family protein [Campylobacterota bacterium]